MAEDDRGVGVLEVLVQVSEWMRTAVSAITSTEPDTTTQQPEMAIAAAILSLSLSTTHPLQFH
jgi:hypothetical protein